MTSRIALLALVALLPSACGGASPYGDGPALGGSWLLISGTSGGAPIPVVEGHRITLLIDGDEAGGVSACNHYFATFSHDGSGVAFTGIGGTEMACMPEEVMASEASYLRALGLITAASRDGELLVLTGPETELRYAPILPVPTADLVGTAWALETLIEGETASSVMGEPAGLELGEDGTFAASTGCRSLAGRYQLRADEVIVTEMTAIGDCPDELAGQDAHVVEVLGDGFTVDVDGDVLTLTTSRGHRGLVYRSG